MLLVVAMLSVGFISCGDDDPINPNPTENTSGGDNNDDETDDGKNDGDGNEDGTDDDGSSIDTNLSDEELDMKDAQDPRRGPVSTSFQGRGTSASPYLISSAADLRLLADECRAGNVFDGKYFKMTDDITINQNVLNPVTGEPNDDSNFERWIPIGRYYGGGIVNAFQGIFDGDGHTISGLYINRNNWRVGLFGSVAGAGIKNITLKDSYIYGTERVGGIVGFFDNISTTGNGYVNNCHVSATVYGKYEVGGVVGKTSYGCKISRCSNHGRIKSKGSDSRCGGIVGFYESSDDSDNSRLSNCVNFGDIDGNMSGGIVGRFYGKTIINCLNKGTVTAIEYGAGICGGAWSTTITNCVNLGSIVGADYNAALVSYVRSYGKASMTTVQYCCYLSSKCSEAIGYIDANDNLYGVSKREINPCSDLEMRSADVLAALNSHKGSGNSLWVTGSDGYPMLEWVVR